MADMPNTARAAGEHGAGSRVRSPDAFAVSSSFREGLTSGFESPVSG